MQTRANATLYIPSKVMLIATQIIDRFVDKQMDWNIKHIVYCATKLGWNSVLACTAHISLHVLYVLYHWLHVAPFKGWLHCMIASRRQQDRCSRWQQGHWPFSMHVPTQCSGVLIYTSLQDPWVENDGAQPWAMASEYLSWTPVRNPTSRLGHF